jgi:hypothetical protein
MRTQIVQWVFLPAGLTPDGQLAASVFVAPRLRSDEGSTLADFPDFTDWPATLNSGLGVTLQRDDGTTEAPMQVMSSATSELWQALFPPETPVRPFVFGDYADRPIVTYPVLEVLDHLRDRWARLAAGSIDDLPLTSRSAAPIGPTLDLREPNEPILSTHFEAFRDAGRIGVFEGVNSAEEFSDRLAETLRRAAAQAAVLRAQHHLTPQPLIEPFALSNSTAGNLYRLAGFHRRPEVAPAEFPAAQAEAVAELQEHMEFHHLLSSLGEHPALLRALGLVVDLIIRPDFVPSVADTDPPGQLRVLVERPSAFPPKDGAAQTWNVDVQPWTLARLTSIEGEALFTAAERPGPDRQFAHGFVRTDPARYDAVAVDVDGLSLKSMNMAATLSRQESATARPVEEPARDGVPTPRTGGMAFVKTGHGQDLHDGFYQARANDDALTELDPDNPPILGAEDLVRGYRVDVRDGERWRSLHQRIVNYLPLRLPPEEVPRFEQQLHAEDEGIAQVSVTSDVSRPDAPADPDGALYAHEGLFSWDGWSLAAPRPESAIPQEPAVPEAAAEQGALQLDIDIAARPGSLPLLRFGREYQLRVRTVDLAGNAHSVAQADHLTQILDGLPDYPVSVPPTPLVYRRFEPVPAPELVARRRFGPGEGLERLVVRSNFDTSAADYAEASQQAAEQSLRFVPFCDRHVAAAKASLQLTELHGMFDDALAAVRGLPPADAALAIQSFYDIASRESGSFRDTPGAEVVMVPGDAPQQTYVVIDTDRVDLPYLPDPYCGGAVVRVQFPDDVVDERILEFRPVEGWHDLQPVRIRLEEGDVAGSEFVDVGTFVLRLPRGRTARLQLNSLLAGDPELFGVLDWCRSTLSAAQADEVAAAITESRHWMTTPWRTIELVHAVQQPLAAPLLELELPNAPDFRRDREATAAALSGFVRLDIPSTARLDLVADWDEVVDDPNFPLDVAAMVKGVHASVFSIALPEPFGTPWGTEIDLFLKQHDETLIEFHTATPEQETPEQIRQRLLTRSRQAGITVQEQHHLAAAAAHIEELRRHEFGDTRYRRVQYQMIASSRFREYFDPAMTARDGQQLGDVQIVEMLSSAVPVSPAVIDVVPILRWISDDTSSTRRGVGLRVWLRRPWFTTGAGELLGVVCRDDGMVGTNSAEYRDVTYIARDAAHGGVVPQPLAAAQFVGAVTRIDEIPVQTSGGRAILSLAGYQPRYDPERDAWYCDLEFATGTAYFPFVRLGLVRYQPHSLPGCEVSPVVATSFVQTLPDRTLTIVQGTPLAVTLHGPAPASRADNGVAVAETNVVVAVLEEQDPRVQDVALGWFPAGADVELTATIQPDGTAMWHGEVDVPVAAGVRRRLSVREYEIHPTIDRSAGAVAGAMVAARRLVHADVISID